MKNILLALMIATMAGCTTTSDNKLPMSVETQISNISRSDGTVTLRFEMQQDLFGSVVPIIDYTNAHKVAQDMCNKMNFTNADIIGDYQFSKCTDTGTGFASDSNYCAKEEHQAIYLCSN